MVADMVLIYTTWTTMSGRNTLKTGFRQSERQSIPYIFIRNGMSVAICCDLSLLTSMMTS